MYMLFVTNRMAFLEHRNVLQLATLPENINPRTLSERKTEDTFVFGGILSEYHKLSNFFKYNNKHRGKTFNCVEQSFQWSKEMLFGDYKTASAVLSSTNPTQQKNLNKNVSGFDK